MEVEETLTSAHGGAAEDGPIADASGVDDDTDEARMLALISEKEREVTALRERRLADLQSSLADKCKEVDSYKARLGKVEDDFKYNLEVLDERDRELREFEDVLAAEHKKHEERSKMLSGARNLVAALQVRDLGAIARHLAAELPSPARTAPSRAPPPPSRTSTRITRRASSWSTCPRTSCGSCASSRDCSPR